ncbi:MAG: hypothetical protein WC269_04600 [Candidatus Gracilibacteria bacterium]|jgi:hypothetical protein
MGFLKWLYLFFSSYVNLFERRVDKFFNRIKSTDNIADIREELLKLMQENLIVLNVWLEKKFKGYKYLSKGVRKKMYADTEKIKQKFAEFCKNSGITKEVVSKFLDQFGISYPTGDDEKILYITQIMAFLAPGKYYHYIKTSSFGKLLRDPDKEKMEGDCNQIVTLYIYLYSLKFPLNDLKIKLLTEHVCLQFREIDIEATAGQFAKYKEYEHVLRVTEIISTNLLDIADFREQTSEISPRVILKSSQLAYAISSLRTLVEKNLKIAYTNMALYSLSKNDISSAEFFAEKAGDQQLLFNVYRNAATYYTERSNFTKALYYAQKSGNSSMIEAVKHNEAAYEYTKLSKKVADVRTLNEAKDKKPIYQKMLVLAQRLGDTTIEHNLRDTIDKISK